MYGTVNSHSGYWWLAIDLGYRAPYSHVLKAAYRRSSAKFCNPKLVSYCHILVYWRSWHVLSLIPFSYFVTLRDHWSLFSKNTTTLLHCFPGPNVSRRSSSKQSIDENVINDATTIVRLSVNNGTSLYQPIPLFDLFRPLYSYRMPKSHHSQLLCPSTTSDAADLERVIRAVWQSATCETRKATDPQTAEPAI